LTETGAGSELRLIYDWDHSLYPPDWKRSVLGTLFVHLLLVAGVGLAPRGVVHQPIVEVTIAKEKATPLIAPRLSWSTPNRGQARREVTLDDLIAPKTEATGRPAPPPRPFVAPRRIEKLEKPVMDGELPPVAAAQGSPQIQVPQFTLPNTPPVEKPKLAFENPGSPTGTPTGTGRLAPPRNTVDEAVKASIRKGASGGAVVSDLIDLPPGGGASLSATPNQGKAGSRLEMLSDPQGVDFQPYLIRILASIRRNWFAVIPESVRYGQRGRTVIQFAISREGRVPKLVISLPSGTESLDRAAVAGISASNPFPPLPAEFRGNEVRLQLSFLYNMPAN
jgi:TonB family protein